MTYNLFHFILPFMYLLYYMFPVYDMTYNLSPFVLSFVHPL